MYKYVQLFFGTCGYMRTSTVDTLIVIVVEEIVVIIIVIIIVDVAIEIVMPLS